MLSIASLTAAPAWAENPFKSLRSKAKQGLSKVARVVSPRRIVSAIRNDVADPAPRVPMRQVYPPARIHDGTADSDGTIYYPESPSNTRRYPEENPARPAVAGSPNRYSEDPDTRRSVAPARPISDPSSAPVTPSHAARPRNPSPGPASPTASGSGVPRQIPDLEAPAANLEPTAPGTNPKVVPATQTSSDAAQSARKSAPRQDLPFGELAPGKTGFVYSPYSTKELVDVSGIPTGTKVKCPYSGKTFRVP